MFDCLTVESPRYVTILPMKFADPRNDIAFKKIFGNAQHKEVLIHFVNAALDFPEGAKVVDVNFKNPYQPPKIEDLKETVLDVTATDQQGRSFIIEMQVQRDSWFAKRSLYYTAKSYVNQLDAGEDYQQLKKVHFIGILDFDFSLDAQQYLSNHLILNTRTGQNQLNDFAFCFIELPKFDKTLEQLEGVVDQWIYFLKHTGKLESIPALYQQDPVFKTAFEVAKQHSWSSQELEVYDYISLRRGRELNQIQTAREEGREEGHEALAAKAVPALIMLGQSDDQIAETLGLHHEVVARFRK